MEDEIQVMDGDELVQAWQEQNKAWHFEGDAGLDRLTQLVEVLGYTGHGFKHGSPIESFLSDNPGACEKIVEFISEWAERNREWREALENSIDPTDNDEEG